jgi:hypothetical protein
MVRSAAEGHIPSEVWPTSPQTCILPEKPCYTESKSFHPLVLCCHFYYYLLSNNNLTCSVCEISQTLDGFCFIIFKQCSKNHALLLIFRLPITDDLGVVIPFLLIKFNINLMLLGKKTRTLRISQTV